MSGSMQFHRFDDRVDLQQIVVSSLDRSSTGEPFKLYSTLKSRKAMVFSPTGNIRNNGHCVRLRTISNPSGVCEAGGHLRSRFHEYSAS